VESYVLPREELPPFKCKVGPFGLEVLVGYGDPGGGRWAIRNRDSEEKLRCMLQSCVDTHSNDEGEPPEYSFEESVHFILSHAVQMGWYILVSKAMMDELEEVDNERRLPPDAATIQELRCVANSYVYGGMGAVMMGVGNSPAGSYLACPKCNSRDVVLIEESVTVGRRNFDIEDGKIQPGELYGEEVRGSYNKFGCSNCNEVWEIPPEVERKIDW
jgi:hypothetical protein